MNGVIGRMPRTPDTAPTVEPITVREAADWARIDTTDDDATLTALITVARQYAEGVTGQVFINATWKNYWDQFPPGDALLLSWSPLSSVTSIQYVDDDGATQTLAADQYTADVVTDPPRIVEAYNVSWPSTRAVINAVTATFVAGYGAAASNVPDNYLLAIKMLVAHWYEIRGPVIVDGRIAEVPFAVMALLMQDRTWSA